MMSAMRFAIKGITFFIALGLTAADQSLAAEFRIVTQQSLEQADRTTHEIRSGGVILGISEFGGGYINKLVIPGVGDVIARHAARYGRGGQVSIRDRLHRGRYNPTQGGFTDRAGTNCAIEQLAKGRLFMPPRPAALWNGDGKYDFTQWENLARDPYPHDKGNSDSDNIDESMLFGKQATEITSEFDLTATYQDVRDGETIRIPAFRFSFEFRFVREPGHALRQFQKGTPVYDSSAEIADRSNLAPPRNHPSTEDSLTGIILSSTLRGDKAVWDPDVVLFVNETGKLVAESPNGAFRRPFSKDSNLTKSPLVIFSTSMDPDQGPALGYYHPHNHINQFSVVGRLVQDHSIAYEDTRESTGVLIGSFARTPDMWLFGARTAHAGLLSVKETPRGVYEAIRGESYILVGTPNELIVAARAIDLLP